MSVKTVDVEGLGEVNIYKRRGASNVRLSITGGNQVRVTIPWWAPYKVATDFLQTKKDWIIEQRKPEKLLVDGQQIGKAHHLRFVKTTGKTATTRVKGSEIVIGLPPTQSSNGLSVQALARKAAIRALKKEAESLLPQRLKTLADQHGFSYRSVSIKQMKGRWGSCNQHTDIVLNCFLMQLQWELIDYVLLHELMHTRIMAHGPKFWAELAHYVPKLASIRKYIKTQSPTI